VSPTVATSPATAPSRPRRRPTATPQRRHLRPVPEQPVRAAPRSRRRLRPQVALTVAVGVFFLILFGVALLQTALVQGQLRLDGLQADVAERQTEAQRLRYLVAEGGSPDNIRRLATEMGMAPKPQQFLVSDPEPEPATP
jgi:cell division protein FtsL